MKITLDEALNDNKPKKGLGTIPVQESDYIKVNEFFMRFLKGYELLAFCLIYNICTQCDVFTGSTNYVASRIHCNIPYASNQLKSLVEKGLLIKSNEPTIYKTYTYTLPDNLYEVFQNLKEL